jgi:hypothetical protein
VTFTGGILALAALSLGAVTYPLAYDEGGLLYGRISLRMLAPTTAFVRPDGTLAGVHIGQVDAAEVRGLIGQYLGIQVPA